MFKLLQSTSLIGENSQSSTLTMLINVQSNKEVSSHSSKQF